MIRAGQSLPAFVMRDLRRWHIELFRQFGLRLSAHFSNAFETFTESSNAGRPFDCSVWVCVHSPLSSGYSVDGAGGRGCMAASIADRIDPPHHERFPISKCHVFVASSPENFTVVNESS